MKLIFDARVLSHSRYSGVENYAKYILSFISLKTDTIVAAPKNTNKYLAHLWTHFVLPFLQGDILFCPANIAPLFTPKSKKLVFTLHDVAFITHPKSFSYFFRLYYIFIVPINIKRAQNIITVSNYSKKEIESFYPYAKGKVMSIQLGVDEKFMVLNIPKKKQILYVGSMNERKNFAGVLKAFELLDSSEYNLVMIGAFSEHFTLDEESKELLQKAKENPLVTFVSNISDERLVEIYNESSLFLFPSFYEGFGLPVLEAMACGTPVITSNVASLPEVGGDAVVYCDPYSVEDIKQKMEIVLRDEALQKQMVQKGLARAKEFSWEKSAQEHMNVFQEVMKS